MKNINIKFTDLDDNFVNYRIEYVQNNKVIHGLINKEDYNKMTNCQLLDYFTFFLRKSSFNEKTN